MPPSAVRTTNESGPRRSSLSQARAQDTRRRLIRAALALWAERGFERGLEETSAEEIAAAAGVSKGTFYFHFAHKEDILLEMTWATAESMATEAERAMAAGVDVPSLLDQLVTSLARRVSRVPRAAVTRAMGHWPAYSMAATPRVRSGLAEVFATVLGYGSERGDVPAHVDRDDLARLLESAAMGALANWAGGTAPTRDLTATLRLRTELILRGAYATYPNPAYVSHQPRAKVMP